MDKTDYLLEQRLFQLDPQLHRRFTNTVSIMPLSLDSYRRLFPEYTDHSIFHSMNVLQFCNDLIGEEQIERMSAYECYVLLMSCYLHDIGMGISESDYEEFKVHLDYEDYFRQPGRDVADFVRDNHHEFSGLYIRKYADLLEIPSPELVFAITQVARGHRRTDLFDVNEYPTYLQINGNSPLNLPYLAAVIRMADEIDVVRHRNPSLLYDIETLTDAHQIECNRLLQAVPRMDILPDKFVLDVLIEDELSGDEKLLENIRNMAGKMQKTLDVCRSVTELRTPFRITQKHVELNFLDPDPKS